jgi:hypothetical protein
MHPLYGECLITQGYEKEQIKIFCKKKFNIWVKIN